jgi:hypothetical protein
MMVANEISATPPKRGRVWLVIGLALLVYAVLGNYFVLPGYRQFLKHGSPRAGEPGIDFVLVWGAAKTILWMLSFHIGAFCLALAALTARGQAVRSFRRWFAVGALVWIGLWAIPSLPGPYSEFFAGVGIVIVTMIALVFAGVTADAPQARSIPGTARGGHWLIASCFFFALATWDMCGLGSVGGILHPADEVRAASQSLVVAQATKLIIEIAIAWGLLAIGTLPGRPSGGS